MVKTVRVENTDDRVSVTIVQDSWGDYHLMTSVRNFVSVSPKTFITHDDALEDLDVLCFAIANPDKHIPIQMVKRDMVESFVHGEITEEDLLEAGVSINMGVAVIRSGKSYYGFHHAFSALTAEGYVIW